MTTDFEFRLHIQGPDASWDFSVPIGQSTIGRQAGNNLMLDDPQISRQHAQLDCTSTECHISDLGSSNGTRVNGQKLTPNVPVILRPKDLIIMGPFTLEVEKNLIEIPQVEAQPRTKELPAKGDAKPSDVKPPSKPALRKSATPPPKPPLPPQSLIPSDENMVPPGLSIHSTRFLNYLPDIYHTDFMSRYLAIFEAILIPIEWDTDNFDLYLSPETAPNEFLPWLENWFGLTFDITWSEGQRRQLLADAHRIYARRGTRWALNRMLEIYIGQRPEIIDQGDKLAPFTFVVKLPLSSKKVNQELIEAIIDAHKPAHTSYEIKFMSN